MTLATKEKMQRLCRLGSIILATCEGQWHMDAEHVARPLQLQPGLEARHKRG